MSGPMQPGASSPPDPATVVAGAPKGSPGEATAPDKFDRFVHADWIVESFSVGYCACPMEYRDHFVDAFIDSHSEFESQLYAALTAIGVAERISESSRARRLSGTN